MTKTWDIGDQFRASDRTGNYFTGTIVQELDEEYLVGRWRMRDGKRLASYLLVKESSLRFASKKAVEAPAPKGTKTQWSRLYAEADAAGRKAANASTPAPMLVGTPKDMMASLTGGDDGGFDEKEPVYYVADGVCGFAWVLIRPGNSSFARWLVKTDKGSAAYGGGVSIWVSGYGQSMQRKEAYAGAFAKVLQAAGITAYSQSRMD